ncbi:lens fiber major intrinsic protein-like isoform X1 [Ostrinia furnacalis]|uniref:lens fiber major intrinsic protein-like isoform X1 n=1 Tax=Ostrinia furnacalis TaxID=93504 RepID=UPI00103CE36C|nr:lens fiber major intrinsic protein-like isoform X1 [Ostrinia furnacalis]
MPRNDEDGGGGRGARAWVVRWWRALLAELLATALLVLLGVATLVVGPAPLTHPALAFGFVVLINVVAFGPASGAHMNPAVTLAALVCGKIAWAPALAYAVAQMLGATLGFGALLALVPTAAAPAGCTRSPLAPAAAAAVEALLTGSLALIAAGVWAEHDERRPDRSVPIKFGLAIAGLVYAGGPLTGASLNPARSFGPALIHGFWKDHWVYWVGPLGGAALGAALHRWVLTPPPPAPAALRPEQLPLQDKV